jgi:DNA polymerase
MDTFFTYSTMCRPKEGAPFNRGPGEKTYLAFFPTADRVSSALEAIPQFEEVLTTRIYRNDFPEHPRTPLHSLDSIADVFQNCQRCTLSHHRIFFVSHRGDDAAKVVLLGQSPGHDEDTSGFPFVGKSGRLLDEMLAEARFPPCLLLNLVGCRPDDGNGRERTDPTLGEMTACAQRLWAMLTVIRPKIVIALGLLPACVFFGTPSAARKIPRNYFLHSGSVLIAHTFHPAFLLRRIQAGSEDDMLEEIEFFRKVVNLPVTSTGENWHLEGGLKFVGAARW